MDYFAKVAVFTAQTAVIVLAVLIVLSMLFFLLNRNKIRPQLEVEKLNKRYRSYRKILQSRILSKKDFKAFLKLEKGEPKKKNKNRIFVIDFKGDMRASAVSSLAEEITAILSVATTNDEVVLRLESPGGLVHAYGLAASHLQRVKDRKIPLTICVDKMAASGGYMMACIADRILAAPFAIIGSIGVVAHLPNFHRVLEKHDIEYQEVTAGQHKRTVSMLAKVTPEGFAKFKHQIQQTHDLFKNFIQEYRPSVNLDEVATGEYWYATQAIPLRLVDEIKTSDDYLFSLAGEMEIFKVTYRSRKKFTERFSEGLSDASHSLLRKIWDDLFISRFES